nr:sugar transferase [Candidatus Levybacteria bacterium]
MPYTEIKKSGFYEFSKRLMDVAFSLILIVIFSPVILIVSILIKLDSKGPVLADTPQR